MTKKIILLRTVFFNNNKKIKKAEKAEKPFFVLFNYFLPVEKKDPNFISCKPLFIGASEVDHKNIVSKGL